MPRITENLDPATLESEIQRLHQLAASTMPPTDEYSDEPVPDIELPE
jgi:hypothetical protein